MKIEEAITAHLLANIALAAKLGARVFPMRMPQSPTLPAIVYSRITTSRVESYAGASGLTSARFQFDVYGKTFKDVIETAELLRLAIQGFRGLMGGVGGVEVGAILFDNEIDDYIDDLEVYWKAVDYTVWNEEP